MVQLEELLSVRHSVFVVGAAGTGKSQVLRSLHKTYQRMRRRPVWTDLNPKAVTNDELFGVINPATREWRDGKCPFVAEFGDKRDIFNEAPEWMMDLCVQVSQPRCCSQQCEGLLLEGHVGCHSFLGIYLFAIRIIIMSVNTSTSQFLIEVVFWGWAAGGREFLPALCCALRPPKNCHFQVSVAGHSQQHLRGVFPLNIPA